MVGLPIITHEFILRGSEKLEKTDVSLGDWLVNNLGTNPDNKLEECETGRTISNKELLRQIITIAEWLKSRGVKPNDVIAISSENRIEFAVPLGATLCIGGSFNTLNPLYTINELTHVLSISRPKIVFCSPFTASKIKEVSSNFPFIQEIVLFGVDTRVEGFTNFMELLEKKVDVHSFRCQAVNTRESVAAILCSSGTTGLPKCVELTHSNLGSVLSIMETGSIMKPEYSDTILGLIPFFHGYGLCLLLANMILNVRLVIMSRFEEKTFLSTVEKYRINMLHIVPPLAVFLAKHPLVDKYDLSCVENIVCGAAPLSKEVETAIKKRLKSVVEMRQAYGMTELSVAVVIPPSVKGKVGSVGVVAPTMECKVIDTETGKALPPYKEGELCFRGPLVMKGYRNNPSATAETLRADGWLHTGDIGYYDEEGFMFIVDRLKELIKYKGFQVAPAELEAILLTNPKIKDAGVIGFPDEAAGELPLAFVVLQPDVKATEEEIKKFVAAKVSPQKRLQIVRFVDEIPKNPSGKILRKELRKMLTKAKM